VIRTGILHQYYTIKKNKVYREHYNKEYESTYDGMVEKYNHLFRFKEDVRIGKHLELQEEGLRQISVMKEVCKTLHDKTEMQKMDEEEFGNKFKE